MQCSKRRAVCLFDHLALGSVGLDWQLGGFAADPPIGSMSNSGSTSQLVQAMAGFGGGAADDSNTVPPRG
jgi:hypothetical protein